MRRTSRVHVRVMKRLQKYFCLILLVMYGGKKRMFHILHTRRNLPFPSQRRLMSLDFLLEGADAMERQARLREIRALVAVYSGWDHPAKRIIDQALRGEASEAEALAEVDRLPARTRRRLLASYGALR
jgi:hypothetical protein